MLDALKEHQIKYEKVLKTAGETLEISQAVSNKSRCEQMGIAKDVLSELKKFNADYDLYQKAKRARSALDNDLLLSFEAYAALRGMHYIPLLLKPFVPGFGYGALSHCPAYCVLEYFGKGTLPDMMLSETLLRQPPLLAIQGGFQRLMEEMAQNERYTIHCDAQVTKVTRQNNSVTVHYLQNGLESSVEGDLLILANSPRNWPSLGMALSETEKKCVNQLEFYRYPVAVYRIKGMEPQHYFFPPALEEQGFGHLALITTRDNREEPPEGRLCTVYVNLRPNQLDYNFDHNAIVNELKTIPGVTGADLVKDKVWEDYMSTLPWDVRLELEAQQNKNNTLYLGSYTLGSFEDVACVAFKAADTVNQFYAAKPSYTEDRYMKQAFGFFTGDIVKPVSSNDGTQEKYTRSCTIL